MVPQRLRYSAENCSIGRTLEIVGEKWTLLVLREAFYGVSRFAEFQAATGCARNILSDRLATLVEHGLLARHPYREAGRRERHHRSRPATRRPPARSPARGWSGWACLQNT